MTIELAMLACSIVLGLAQILVAAHFKTKERGLDWNIGPRDEPEKPLGVTAGRLERARGNFLETFPFFAAAVLMAAVAGRHNWLTQSGAVLYFAGRLVYVPLYAWGIPVARTLAWGVAMLGIVLVLIGLI
jgi:uncharacterized MAPEG superfamily protein